MPSASGTGGNGPLAYAVAQNPGPARVLTATIGCQTFTVNQGGVATSNPVPAITTIQPPSTPAGTTNLTLTVNGTNFGSGATVLFNGLPRTTTYVSSGKVTAAILDRDVDSVGNRPRHGHKSHAGRRHLERGYIHHQESVPGRHRS